jgi:hypothetical protein
MEVLRVLKREIFKQVAVSRNIKETWWCFSKRCFWAGVYLLKGVRTGFRSLSSEQLGSRVTYEGRECFVNNWANGDTPSLCDGNGWCQDHCDRSKIVNHRGPKELWHRFTFGFSWYMGNWYGIDVQNSVYP